MQEKDEYNKPGFITFALGMGISLIYFVWLSFFHEAVPVNVIKKGSVMDVKVEE